MKGRCAQSVSAFLMLSTLQALPSCVAPDTESAESVQDITLGQRSREGVSVAAFNGQMFMAYIGTDSAGHVNVASSADGLSYPTNVTFGSNTGEFTPAIVPFNGRMFLAWTGPSNHLLNIASSTDGLHYSNQIVLGQLSATGPALGVANGRLYLAWTGTEAGNPVHVAFSTDGVTFQNQTTVSIGNGRFPPVLAGAGNVIYLAVTSPSQGQVVILSAPGDLSFSGFTTGAASATGPGLATTLSGQLHLAWTRGQLPVLWTYQLAPDNTNPSFVGERTLINQRTNRNPSVAGFNNQLFYFWTGDNSSHNVNVVQL